MQVSWRTIVKGVMCVAAAMITIVVFHLGGSFAHTVGQFSPLTGAFIGGSLAFISVCAVTRREEHVEPWIGYEWVGWILISLGVIMWGVGETFWRYYMSMGETPFPSIADVGYSSFPVLVFVGLLLQPSPEPGGKRLLLLVDSLISMGSILAIAWYLLLGSLAQAPGEASLAKFLGLYYPISDTALLSCVVFLLLRGQGRAYQATARRTALFLVGLGLCFFVTSDFVFNIQQNAGTYVEATWIDLGWPLGLMTIGVAACIRRFFPATPASVVEQRMQYAAEREGFGPVNFIPYLLLTFLFLALSANVFSNDAGQQAIRPVLVFSTIAVVALVITRQMYTLWENVRLARKQAEALEDLERANQRIEEQARQITAHNILLEEGIEHLKNIQAQLANGNLRARATLKSGPLMPLAGSLNLMADRLTRLGQMTAYAQQLARGLNDLSAAFERSAVGAPLILPSSCSDLLEINRLVLALRIQGTPAAGRLQTMMPPAPLPHNERSSLMPDPAMPPGQAGRSAMAYPAASPYVPDQHRPPEAVPETRQVEPGKALGVRRFPISGPLQLSAIRPQNTGPLEDGSR
ncbi:MAG TPA: hypothetical protein VFA09_02645 [Ktedonobacteraceae bacterium]|nr:hypothetical protein [Ktedonobacteraceae bacterium]